MLSINTNLSSLIAQTSLKNSTNILNQAVERMTTGYKINHASDNAANYSIATNMSTKISAYQVAEDNALQGLDMINTASENLSLIEDKLQRLRALATQASNGTYGDKSLSAINSEAMAHVQEIERLYSSTEHNGYKIFTDKGEPNPPSGIGVQKSGKYGDFISNPKSYSEADLAGCKFVKEVSSFESGKIYTISDAEDLVKLASMVNNGISTRNVTFVLTSDIDLGAWCDSHMDTGGWETIGYYNSDSDYKLFLGTFDGNGHTIYNLKIDRNSDLQGLFGHVSYLTTIKNLELKNVDIKGGNKTGAVVAHGAATITNCIVSGSVKSNANYVGGIVGNGYEAIIKDAVNRATVIGVDYVGGIVGCLNKQGEVINSYSDANIIGNNSVGGIVGFCDAGITSCDSRGNISGTNYIGGLAGTFGSFNFIKNSVSSANIEGAVAGGIAGKFYGDNLSNCCSISQNVSPLGDRTDETLLTQVIFRELPPKSIDFQVGVTSSQHSIISLELGFKLDDIVELNKIGIDMNANFFEIIDNLLQKISTKQTEYGASQNRLESALEEILTQYDNLVSSRSTLRDADIAKVSADYIRQQILQQASATLMATANQSPAIALQLI